MRWFWDQYLPDFSARAEPIAAPLRASTAQLADLPPALVVTAECDPLRDEGEAYARKIMQAGVPVTATRYLGTIHAFVVLNSLRQSQPARAAIAQAALYLRQALRRAPIAVAASRTKHPA
jgi:acetyl esterase